MAWNIFLTGAGALAGLTGLAVSAIEPQFDYELAAPSQATPVLYQASPNVSVQFHDTSVGDVLAWLEKQGVSFVVSDPKLKERTITLNVQNQPLDQVVDSIASALGGHWERKGDIRIFKDGEGFGMYSFTMPQVKTFNKNFMDGLPTPDGQGTWNVVPPAMPDGKAPQIWNVPPGQPEMRQFKLWNDDPKAKALEEQIRELAKNPDENGGKIKELKKKLGELRKREGGAFIFGNGDGPGTWNVVPPAFSDGKLPQVWNVPPGQPEIREFRFQMDPKMKELEKQMEELRKNPDDPKNQEKMKVLKKKLGELRVFGKGDGQGTWNFMAPGQPDIREFQFQMNPKMKELQKQLDELAKNPDQNGDKIKELQKKVEELKQSEQTGVFFGDGNAHPFHFTYGFDLDRFSKSLSDKQKDLMKSQGYLKIGDLTEEQRSQLGIVGNPEHFELDYSKDGQNIVIKSK